MKWTLHPKNKELTTSIPLSIEISEWNGIPEVNIEALGKIELKKTRQNTLKADFYFIQPGSYRVQLKDSLESYSHTLEVEEYTYLNFRSEFGFFFVAFLIVMTGVILWTSSIMRKSTKEI